MKKMRMYEEMFQKKAQEEERKKKLKEAREIRKSLQPDALNSQSASAVKQRRGRDGDVDIDVISEAD